MWLGLLIGFIVIALIITLIILPLACVYNLYGLDRCNPAKINLSPCGQGTFKDKKCICNDGWTGKWCQINKDLANASCTEPGAFKFKYATGSLPACLSKLNVCPCPESSCLPHDEYSKSSTSFVLKKDNSNYCMHDAFDGDYTDSSGAKISIVNGDMIYDGENLGKNTFQLYTDTKDECLALQSSLGCKV